MRASLFTALVALAAVLSGCGQPRHADVPPHAVEEQFRELASLLHRSGTVWPGFELDTHVLIAALMPGGPTFVLGGSALAPESIWLDRAHPIAVREGSPPPELRGLRVAMPWQGKGMAATSFPISDPHLVPILTSVLVHESFHTHQRRLNAESRGVYESRGNACFPDSSARPLALLNLEGHYLAETLRATDLQQVREIAARALSVRLLRCEELGPEECARQRSIEQIEGTASYVEEALTGQLARYGEEWRDSLLIKLSPVTLRDDLTRGHYYRSGMAWLLTLDRLEVDSWKEVVATSPPDEVLRAELSLESDEQWRSIAAQAVQGPTWLRATEQAEAAREAWQRPTSRLIPWRRLDEGFRLTPGCPPSGIGRA